MDSRTSRFWVILLASALVWITLVGAGAVRAANAPPVAEAWNITSSGKATSSGELLFRVSPGDGRDPVEVTVFVLSGSNETGVASSIRRALDTQLDRQRFDVEAGEGANVMVRGESRDGFSLELVDSDVNDVRVVVSSATPVAPPTVPPQREPANAPVPSTPSAPGDANPPAGAGDSNPSSPPANPSAPPASPSAPPAGATAPPATPSAPSGSSSPPPAGFPAAEGQSPAHGGAGAPASAPPPPPASPGG